MSRADRAAACHDQGFNCAQAVFSTYSEQLGVDPVTALRVAGGFGGGMGFLGEVCGAVTGAIMLIGLKHGKIHPDDNEAKEKTYVMVQEFAKRFKDMHATILCRELLNTRVDIEECRLKAKENGVFNACNNFIRDACEIVEDLLELK